MNPLNVSLCVFCLFVSAAQAADRVPASLLKQLEKQWRADVKDMEDCRPAKGMPFRVLPLDLNGDGKPEYQLIAAKECECGEANCPQWIYRQTETGLALIWDGFGYTVSIAGGTHNGYRDIESVARVNIGVVERNRYAFDGKRYRLAESQVENLETHERKLARQRIRFAAGKTSAMVGGTSEAGFVDSWVLGARAGQTMSFSLVAKGKPGAVATLMAPKTGHLLADRVKSWSGALPDSGDYIIVVDADGEGRTQYSLEIGVR